MSRAIISTNRLFQLNQIVSRLFAFAKPGEMSKKILAGSFGGEGVVRDVVNAVTAKVDPPNVVEKNGTRYIPTKEGLRRVKSSDLVDVNAATDARRKWYDYAKENGISVDDRNKEAPVTEWVKGERRKLAAETGLRRKMLQGIRRREVATNGGTAPSGYKLGPDERASLNDSVARYKKTLSSLNRKEEMDLKNRGKKFLAKMTKRAEGRIQAANPDLLSDIVSKRAADAVSILSDDLPPTKEYVDNLKDRLGMSEGRIKKVRETLSKFTSPGSDREGVVRRAAKHLTQPVFGGSISPEVMAESLKFPVRPKGYKGPVVDATKTSFPIMKKLGIAAGVLGGGALAAKLLSGKKTEESKRGQKMLMSDPAPHIQFARGDRLRDLLKVGARAVPTRVKAGGSKDVVGRVSSGLMKHYRQTPFAKKLKTERAVRELWEQNQRQQAGRAKMAENIERAKAERLASRPTPFTSKSERKQARKEASGAKRLESRNPDSSGNLPLRERRDRTESVWHDRIIPALEQGEVKTAEQYLANRLVFTHSLNKDLQRRNKDLVAQSNDLRRLYNPKVAEAAMERAKASERGVAELQRTYKDRVQKEVSGAKQALEEQHAKAMNDEQSKRYRHVGIGVGAGLVGGAVIGSSAMNGDRKNQKQLQFERGEYDDAKRMAISSAVTGAAGGGIVAALLRPRGGNAFRKGGPAPKPAPLRKQFNRIGKAAFKAGAYMGAAGLASSLVGRAILGKPDKRDAAAAAKAGAVGGAVVGGLSGAALGALSGVDPKKRALLGLAKKASGVVRRNQNWIPVAAMGRGGVARRVLIGGTVGTLAGAAQMADEGQQADTIRNLKRMSSKVKSIRFAEAPLSGKLAVDRYRKRIQDEDLDRRDANILRTALSGAALGGMLKGRRGAAIGAGAGVLSVPLIRTRTESGKDMYGERTREGKKAEGIPWKAALLATGALGVRRGFRKADEIRRGLGASARDIKKAAKIVGVVGGGAIAANMLMKSKAKTIRFISDDDDESDKDFVKNVEGSKEWRKGRIFANKAIVASKRGTRLAQDLVRAAKGEKNVDSRGRERKREWDKPWVRNTILTGILATGALAGRRIVRGTAEGTKIAEARNLWQSGAFHKAAAMKFPRLTKMKRAIVGTADDAVNEAASGVNQSGVLGKFLKRVREGSDAYDVAEKAKLRQAAGAAAGPIEDAAMKKAEVEGAKKWAKIVEHDFTKDIVQSSKLPGVIRFISDDSLPPGWDTRRDGDMVLLRDIRRRQRREKKLLERKDWQDTVVTPAKMVSSGLAGMGLMAILHRGGRISGKRTGGGARATPASVSSPADDLFRKNRAAFASATKDLMQFSSMLDDLL